MPMSHNTDSDRARSLGRDKDQVNLQRALEQCWLCIEFEKETIGVASLKDISLHTLGFSKRRVFHLIIFIVSHASFRDISLNISSIIKKYVFQLIIFVFLSLLVYHLHGILFKNNK